MKKFISGIIVGALLFTSASAFAGSVSLIGQKVQGLFTIEKAGTKIADAVIINGTAYAPVRAVSEATGTTLTVEGKKIIMSEGVQTEVTTNVTEVDPSKELMSKRDEVTSNIERLTAGIKDLQENVIPQYETMAKEMATNGDLGKRAQASADEYKKLVEERKTELAFYQAELASINAALGE